MDDLRIAIPLILAVVYFLWKFHRPMERRYFDRAETVTPNPRELAFRLRCGGQTGDDHEFTVNFDALRKEFYWGLFTLILGALLLGLHHRYHMIRGNPAILLVWLWGYTIYRWVRSFLSSKDRVRVRAGRVHYYRFGRLRWELPLRQVDRLDIYSDAILKWKTENKRNAVHHLDLHTNIGETFRIIEYERFKDADLLLLLLSSSHAG